MSTGRTMKTLNEKATVEEIKQQIEETKKALKSDIDLLMKKQDNQVVLKQQLMDEIKQAADLFKKGERPAPSKEETPDPEALRSLHP